MDTLFILLMFITALSAVGAVIAFIQYLMERTNLGWALALTSLTITIATTSMIIFSMWKVFGWWSLAMLIISAAQIAATMWVIDHPEILDRPLIRVGGRRVDLR